MIKKLFILCLLFVTLSAQDCKRMNFDFQLNNNSDKAVYYAESSSPTASSNNPDTSLNILDNKPGVNGNTTQKINAHDKIFVPPHSDAILLYIFDADVIEKQPWDSVVKYYKILKRYQISEQQINSSKLIINYP